MSIDVIRAIDPKVPIHVGRAPGFPVAERHGYLGSSSENSDDDACLRIALNFRRRNAILT